MQNHFHTLGLTPGFTLDEKALEQAYFAAQRACHPDRFVGRIEAERVAALQRSQAVNDAYDTLKVPLQRAEHLLLLNGYTALDDDATPPPDLLMEIMELREALAEAAENDIALTQQTEQLKTLSKQCYGALVAAFDSADYRQAQLSTMRLHYLNKALEEAHMRLYRLKAAHG